MRITVAKGKGWREVHECDLGTYGKASFSQVVKRYQARPVDRMTSVMRRYEDLGATSSPNYRLARKLALRCIMGRDVNN